MLTSLLRPFACFTAACLAALSVSAQNGQPPKLEFPAPSPAATMTQRVGLTDIEINYSRPGVKDRQIFGELVPYGQVWRTGANAATKIKFSTPVRLNGTAIPAGTYELFTIPTPEEWTIIVHKDSSDWGAYRYDPRNDVARFSAKPVATPTLIETFTIGLSDVRDESAMLTLSWEKVSVSIKLEVDVMKVLLPQIEAVMASSAEKKPYFQAAMFYLDRQYNLPKAAEWMDAAAAAQPDAFWIHYHKARLLAALGHKEAAIASAQKSVELAEKAGGAVQDEYIRLNKALLAKLQ